MLNDMLGNHAVLNCLRASVDSQDFATQIMEEFGRVPLAATHIQDGSNLEFLDDP